MALLVGDWHCRASLLSLLAVSHFPVISFVHPSHILTLVRTGSNYLAARGADFSESVSDTWRDYVLSNFAAIWGPIAAGYLRKVPFIGHRYSMTIGAVLSMVFFFAYTAVRNVAQNLGISCAITFSLFVYTGALFAYTPEVMPTAHRATGYGIAYGINRLMGIVCAVIGASIDLSSSVPIYICASLFGFLAVISAFLPFEPSRIGSM